MIYRREKASDFLLGSYVTRNVETSKEETLPKEFLINYLVYL